MTEKRFTTDNGSNEDVCLVDNITGKEYESNFYDIVDLLNDLNDGNEKLKSENEDLKIDISVLYRHYDKYEKIYTKLKRENEQLKQFKENVIKWVDSQMKFNTKKYIETEDCNFKSENIDLHNFKVFIGIDSDD